MTHCRSAAARRLVVSTTAGAVTGGRAAITRQDTAAPKGRLDLILVATVPETKHLLTIVRLGAAPSAATIFPKHPHVEG